MGDMTSGPVQRVSDDTPRTAEERLAARKKAQKKAAPLAAHAEESPPEPGSDSDLNLEPDFGTDEETTHELDLLA